ncbi:MAG: methyltransferase domain-containing protein [Promethearchaeota archaeon]|nr:MAG: methyltransferase domain-containing protein [Candidatus Lokiarchaeota archaeon]
MKRDEGLFNHFLFDLKLRIKKILNIHNRLLRKSRIKKYFKIHKEIKLHFGGGKDKLEGFLNTDIIGKIPINIGKKLPFPHSSVDLIYSCHVIEHLYYKQFQIFLKESFRVLKKGGKHIIMTPSLARLIDALYYNKELKPILLKGHEKLAGVELDPALFLNRMMNTYYGHRFLHDFESINRVAKTVGYSTVNIISKSDIPDQTIKSYAIMREKRGDRWKIETETYLLIK